MDSAQFPSHLVTCGTFDKRVNLVDSQAAHRGSQKEVWRGMLDSTIQIAVKRPVGRSTKAVKAFLKEAGIEQEQTTKAAGRYLSKYSSHTPEWPWMEWPWMQSYGKCLGSPTDESFVIMPMLDHPLRWHTPAPSLCNRIDTAIGILGILSFFEASDTIHDDWKLDQLARDSNCRY